MSLIAHAVDNIYPCMHMHTYTHTHTRTHTHMHTRTHTHTHTQDQVYSGLLRFTYCPDGTNTFKSHDLHVTSEMTCGDVIPLLHRRLVPHQNGTADPAAGNSLGHISLMQGDRKYMYIHVHAHYPGHHCSSAFGWAFAFEFFLSVMYAFS